jgi:hypothetical protein
MTQQRVRVEQAVDDEIVGVLGRAQKGSGVVDDRRHPGVGVGALGMVERAEVENGRIDLDGIHVSDALPEGGRHIVARSRPDHRDPARGRAKAIRQLVVPRHEAALRKPGLRLR